MSAAPVPKASGNKDLALRLLKEGYLHLEDVVDRALVDRARAEFEAIYPQSEAEYNDLIALGTAPVVKVGNKRYLVTVDMKGAFADPAIYANPTVVDIAKASLGEKCVLESIGVVLSLPGSRDQHIHSDGHLYHEKIDNILPAFALTILLPLVDMNAMTGTTIIWPGTHRTMPDPKLLKADDPKFTKITPNVDRGSCAVWDYRTSHGGQANSADYPRPALFMTFCRYWYRDVVNHGRKARVIADQTFLDSLPESAKSLFRFVEPQSGLWPRA